MSKTRDTGFLGNVVKVDASGNVSFVSGSTTLATINTSGQLSGSSPVLSASYASNAELLDGLDSTVFTLTSSFNAQTASFTAFSASILAQTASLNSFTASILAQTASLNLFSSSVLTFTGSASTRLGALEAATASLYTATSSFSGRAGALEAATGSLYSYTSSLNNKTSSFATTGSNIFIGTQTITGSILQSGSFTSTGTLTAQTLVVQTITSSVVYSSGSNIFGNAIANTQTFTGSVLVTGSLTIAAGGNASAPTIFGSTIACSPIGCFATSCATSFIGGTMSGTTIYGSTAVCSPVGLFSGCVGIGTILPNGRLEVWQCTNNRLVIDCANVQNEPRISSLDFLNNPQYLTINSYDLKIKTNGNEALRITDKKHLLVGTQTDLSFYSAWDSGVTRIGTSGVLFSYLNNVENFIISQNYYVNAAGNDVRIASGAAANIYFSSGDILFRTIGTGNAESATSWNIPLRLTCTGGSLISGCATFYCTAQFSKIQKHPTGYWYKIPFSVTKNTNVGTATTTCIVNITSQDNFNEMFIYVEYASRLQGQSDTQTQVSSRMYGINRFNSGTIAVTNSYTLVGGAGCVIDTHAPITAVAVGTCAIVVKVDFSTCTSFSSFVWGEIRVYSIENLNSSLTIPYNEW